MSLHGWPTLYLLFVWWFSTGLIIYLDGLPRRTFRWSLLGATVLLGLSLWGMAAVRDDLSLRGAYLGLTFGVLAWGWQEISFYMGFVTGPRRASCPEGCGGVRHFWHGVQTGLYHEIAIIISGVAVAAVSAGGSNRVGLWTFLTMWWMHQSAKLNVFFGVRNLNEEFLPEHLQYLRAFLTRKPMNLLFPVSVSVSTVIAAWLFQRAFSATATPFEAVGFTFLGGLMALAILEHWFLVLPLPAAALWSWGLKSRPAARAADIEVVTGFLGAGKTTFLRRRLAQADSRTVVLVNDFGSLGVDASLLRGPGRDVVELPNGCLCCSLRDDLARQLREVVRRWNPERILIEPSGVAETGGLLAVLARPDLADAVGPIRLCTLVDAGAFLADYARLPDYFQGQLEAAPMVVITKTDLVSAAELATIEETVRALNPDARLVRARYGVVGGEETGFAPSSAAARRPGPEPDHSGHESGAEPQAGLGLSSWSGRLEPAVDETALRAHLHEVATGAYGEVIRAKGIARTRRGWVHFDVAGGRVSVAALTPGEGERGRAVAIGRGLDEGGLEAGFAGCAAEQQPPAPRALAG